MTILRRSRRPHAGAGNLSQVGRPAPSLHGVTPAGEPAEIPMAGATALLLFMTSDCVECRGLWEAMRHTAPPAGLVVVTPSPSTQSRRHLAGLVQPGVVAVMSSDAWIDYGVYKAPWCWVVAGGTVVAGGPAPPTLEGLVPTSIGPRGKEG